MFCLSAKYKDLYSKKNMLDSMIENIKQRQEIILKSVASPGKIRHIRSLSAINYIL